MAGFAWVTLATNDSYSLGALVLAHSLRRVGTQHDLAVLITPGVTEPMREKLAAVFTLVREVNVLDSKDEANLAVLQRPELGITFTKLHCWRLTEYEKCVFVDADALVVKNCDELFEREELSAAPDVGWPDCFNSGVFVFRPSQQTFASLTSFAVSQGSFDGADQGLLNMYFSDWAHKDISKHLPFIYNMCSTATYSYAPAFKQYGDNVKIIHFIGATKPWLQYFDTLTGVVQPPPGCNHLQSLLQVWWNIFCDNVHPQLTDVMGGLAGALSKLTMGESRSDEQRAIEDHMRKQNWEQGHIDFMGRDSFDNILKKINETLSAVPKRQSSPVKETRQPQTSSGKSSAVEAAVEEKEVALPVLATQDYAESKTTQELSENICQRISSSDVPTSLPNYGLQKTEYSLINLDSTISSNTPDNEENKKSIFVSKTEFQPKLDIEETETFTSEKENIKAVLDTAAITSSEPSFLSDTKPIESLEITPQTVSEAKTECPVPIQVAESVLQAEPKESVSEEPRPVVEAVISSITPSLRESAAVVSETPIEPNQSSSTNSIVHPQQLNGNDPLLQAEVEQNSAPSVISTALMSRNPNIVSVIQEFKPSVEQHIEPEIERTTQENQELQFEPKIDDNFETTESKETTPAHDAEKIKLSVVLPPIDKEITCETQILEQSEQSSSNIELSDNEPPIRPNRSKDLKIPATPIVIGPTPPTSPPLDSESIQETQQKNQTAVEKSLTEIPKAETETQQGESVLESSTKVQEEHEIDNQAEAQAALSIDIETGAQIETQTEEPLESHQVEKKTKKIVKKSSAESDTPSSPESEGSSKKPVKKVVKKIKPKEGEPAEGSTGDKQKKIKTPKKISKTSSSTSLETDKSVPETPPPSETSKAPVPPKRKVKGSSSTKAADSKSEDS